MAYFVWHIRGTVAGSRGASTPLDLASRVHAPLSMTIIGTGALRIDEVHHVFGVALAGSCSEGEDFVQAAQFVGAQFHVQRADIFLEIFAALGAGDGHDVVALRQHPGQRQLRRLAFPFLAISSTFLTRFRFF